MSMRNYNIIQPPADGMWMGVQLDLMKLAKLTSNRSWVYIYEIEDLYAEALAKHPPSKPEDPRSHLFWWKKL